jgi:putative membrane protein
MYVIALLLWVRGELWNVIGDTLLFVLIGVAMFGFAFWLIVKLSPFSVRKELEQDHNVALAVVIAAVIIGLAIIIASAIHGV